MLFVSARKSFIATAQNDTLWMILLFWSILNLGYQLLQLPQLIGIHFCLQIQTTHNHSMRRIPLTRFGLFIREVQFWTGFDEWIICSWRILWNICKHGVQPSIRNKSGADDARLCIEKTSGVHSNASAPLPRASGGPCAALSGSQCLQSLTRTSRYFAAPDFNPG